LLLGFGLVASGAALMWWCLPRGGPGVGLIIMGSLILLGTLWERYRYKRLADASPGPGWIDTGERFLDPSTGDLVAVYGRQNDGERQYVRVGPGRAA
jgi:hypothetical protein